MMHVCLSTIKNVIHSFNYSKIKIITHMWPNIANSKTTKRTSKQIQNPISLDVAILFSCGCKNSEFGRISSCFKSYIVFWCCRIKCGQFRAWGQRPKSSKSMKSPTPNSKSALVSFTRTWFQNWVRIQPVQISSRYYWSLRQMKCRFIPTTSSGWQSKLWSTTPTRPSCMWTLKP